MEQLTFNYRVPHMARGSDVSEQLNKTLIHVIVIVFIIVRLRKGH